MTACQAAELTEQGERREGLLLDGRHVSDGSFIVHGTAPAQQAAAAKLEALNMHGAIARGPQPKLPLLPAKELTFGSRPCSQARCR